MSALKYWNGTEWVTLPDIGAKQVWTGPEAPVPIGDHRLWIDTNEPDPALQGSNAWNSTDVGAAGASTANAWVVVPLPTAFTAQGDAGAFTRNVDGSMTVRDPGVYSITASPITGGVAGPRKIACLVKGLDPNAAGAPILAWAECDNTAVPTIASANLAWIGYLPAGQIISVQAYSVEAQGGRLMRSFGIARIGTGPAGPPGPPGPGSILAAQRLIGQGASYRAVASYGVVYAKSDGTVPMVLAFTPPVDCWWEVVGFMGVTRKDDAAYHYGYTYLTLSPNDADGVNNLGQHLITQHSQVNGYDAHESIVLWRLQGGIAYTCAFNFAAGGGAWSYATDSNTLHMLGKAWAR